MIEYTSWGLNDFFVCLLSENPHLTHFSNDLCSFHLLSEVFYLFPKYVCDSRSCMEHTWLTLSRSYTWWQTRSILANIDFFFYVIFSLFSLPFAPLPEESFFFAFSFIFHSIKAHRRGWIGMNLDSTARNRREHTVEIQQHFKASGGEFVLLVKTLATSATWLLTLDSSTSSSPNILCSARCVVCICFRDFFWLSYSSGGIN